MTLRVAVADDQPLVRIGLAGIIASGSGFAVAGEAADGLEAVELCLRTRPDVVLMDVRMPGLDGVAAAARITAATATRVLMLTTFDLDEYVYAALRAGASGFLLKDTPPTQLLEAIAVVASGEALLAPTVTRRLISRFHREPMAAHGLDGITGREREVLSLVAQGLTNTEIAQRLHITVGTAKTHIAHLLTKLDARDRIQLVILAFQSGLALPGGLS